MSRAIRRPTVLVLAAAALAAGCATTSEPTARAVQAPSDGVVIEQDSAYIQQVEQIAMRRGIHVTWVNPPSKRKGFSRR